MRVVVTHTELRLYWPPRLAALDHLLRAHDAELHVIEIAGQGSPYAFAPNATPRSDLNWRCLFTNAASETLAPRHMGRALTAVLDEINPDVVVAGGGLAFPSGATAVRWARTHRRRVIIMDNARLQDVPRSRLTNYIKSRIYRNVDAVFIPAQSHAPGFAGYDIPPYKIFFGLNVLDNQWFATRADAARTNAVQLRRQYALPERFFLAVGRQIPKKNFASFLHAYHHYRQNNPSDPWSLVLVGDGPQRAQLENIAATCNIPDVTFVPFLSPEILCHYYALASAFVLPSFFGETWGLVVNEAMACGLPVIVSDQCGCCDTLVHPQRNGYRFSPDSPEQLTQAMTTLTRQPDPQRQTMAAESRRIIDQWPLTRFAQGLWQAIQACPQSPPSYQSLLDRALITNWHGRYRPN